MHICGSTDGENFEGVESLQRIGGACIEPVIVTTHKCCLEPRAVECIIV